MKDNMFVQYQRKTEGTVAGFDIDADGMSKGGVEITGWLDSDTMEGATENNIPTAQSVKAYVDGQAGHSETLQEVTDNGNTTTNSIMIGSSSSPDTKLEVEGSENGVRFTRAASTNQHISFYTDSLAVGNRIESTVKHFEIKQLTENKDILLSVESGEAMRITSAGKVGIGTTSPSYPLEVAGADSVGIDDYIIHNGDGNTKFGFPSNDKFKVRTAGTDALTIDSSQNVGIGTTSPDTYLQIEDLGSTNTEVDLKVTNTNGSARFGTQSGYSRFWTNDKLKYAVSETVHIWYNDTGTVSMKMDYTGNLLIATTTDSGYKLDVNGTQRVQDVLELDDVLTLNAISTPDDPADGKSSIYMDSADGNIKVKINVGGEVVTRTIASYDG